MYPYRIGTKVSVTPSVPNNVWTIKDINKCGNYTFYVCTSQGVQATLSAHQMKPYKPYIFTGKNLRPSLLHKILHWILH